MDFKRVQYGIQINSIFNIAYKKWRHDEKKEMVSSESFFAVLIMA